MTRPPPPAPDLTRWPGPRAEGHGGLARFFAVAGLVANGLLIAVMTWGGVQAVALFRATGCGPGWCGAGVVTLQVLVVVGGLLVARWWLRLVWSPSSSSGWFGGLPWLTAVLLGFLISMLAAIALVGILVFAHHPGGP
ncbi:hypothetical protein [Salsipaludibacter albus]|uniref:hypothetical protein n=1 Tax=Salsipaludibacter albus TaxID=2849650 RepID=UPI001EE4A11E|nr:hypothetical protein [Salsipaludibacter albus]MBY5162327.1 hypothetical protein [Salsipaludibacter albus]